MDVDLLYATMLIEIETHTVGRFHVHCGDVVSAFTDHRIVNVVVRIVVTAAMALLGI